ncbi:NAD(P)H-binding protein [Hyphomonas sp.]|uniref:NAD(P)H-binding protein n=1 Tax=Hyphomonas sp. TaxID=87 RepID=UPI003918F062
MNKAGIVVTGGTGTVGSALLEELGQRGVQARLIVRDPAKAAHLAAAGHEIVAGDLSEPGSLPDAFEGARSLFLLAPVHRQSADWVHNALAAAGPGGIGRIVRFSAFRADAASGPEILRQHGACDDALKASGVGWTLLKPNGFFQNLLWQAGPIRSEGRFYLPLGDAQLSYLDVRDIAAAAAEALLGEGHEGRSYDLTGSEALDCAGMAAALSEVTGRTITYVPIPLAAAEQSLKAIGLPDWNARAVSELQAWFAEGEAGEISPDLAGLLKRAPRRFADFARDYASAFTG